MTIPDDNRWQPKVARLLGTAVNGPVRLWIIFGIPDDTSRLGRAFSVILAGQLPNSKGIASVVLSVTPLLSRYRELIFFQPNCVDRVSGASPSAYTRRRSLRVDPPEPRKFIRTQRASIY